MMLILGLGVPLIELLIRFAMWLYMIPVTFALIGLGFFRDAFVVLLKHDLTNRVRLRIAGGFAVEGFYGLTSAVLIFLAIYYRKELYQCVASLF